MFGQITVSSCPFLSPSATSSFRLPGMCEGRLGIIQPQNGGEEEDDGDGFQSSRTNMDLEHSQSSYQDLD